MNRDERLPTRVSKACDRCRAQKKRCDLERPCRHCVYARTQCITNAPTRTKKSRPRKHAERQYSPKAKDLEGVSYHAQAYEWQRLSTGLISAEAQNTLGDAGQDGMLWETPKALHGSEAFSPAFRQNQNERGKSGLSGFDADSALAMTRKILRHQRSPVFKERATSAIPGAGYRDSTRANSSNSVCAPMISVVKIIGIDLPTYEICNKLLETYFSLVHWFSLVVYEPRFRERYSAIMSTGLASRKEHGFLLLLIMVLIMGCWYTPKHMTADLGLSANEIKLLQDRLLKVVQRDFMELMDEDSLEFVQVCALLGSFYLYHGRPRSSFSILGAATKTSQAMDLHRDSEARWSFEDTEERKRVWWTIYTWDRFATITYGRPLGINDKDCNVSMPSEISENIHFDPLLETTQICLSAYQHQLNLVYRIASPLLEDIYGIRNSHNVERSSKLPKMVATAHQSLLEWQQDLPPYLSFHLLNDLTADSSTEEKMHSLQALSLQLTYDNLMIVLHRPLLAGQGEIEHSAATQGTSLNSCFSNDVQEVGFKRCLRSALQISDLQRKQNLFCLARATHLVSFLGMNLFTASVVLFICASSDTLSNTAQEAKRGLKKTLQMQKALSQHASLSMQCSRITEDLVQLILKKEMEDMLCDHSTRDENVFNDPLTHNEELQHDLIRRETAPNGSISHTGMFTAPVSTNDTAPDTEGSHFKQSLRTLQRVFHDSSLLRRQDGADGDLGTENDYENSTAAQFSLTPGVLAGSQEMKFNDGDLTRVEDLGQFWLWNMENFPY